jgi:hypothetical protein
MLTTPENLAQEILRVARRTAEAGMGNEQITLELKRHLDAFYRTLCDTAEPRYTRYTDRMREKTEYLVDFCVIRDHWMDTAIESEWIPTLDEIERDFEKLLHVKASLKVMICDSPDYVRDKLVPAVNFLKARYRPSEPEETYMLFNWRGGKNVANCHVWTPTETSPGKSEDIRFRCVPGFPAVVNDKVAHSNGGWLGELA